MWLIGKNKEIKISDKFGDPYFGELVSFLEAYFDAKFIKKKEVEFDLSYFDYSIKGKIITILSEGMSGTSLSGNKLILTNIINKAKEINPKLVENVR